jgi:hypothetical protein
MLSPRTRGFHKRALTLSVGVFALITAICFLGRSQDAEASSTASATANSTQQIITSIAISRVAHLQFGDAAQSDGAKTIDPSAAPSGAGTVTRAEFGVTGEASHSFAVSGLPVTITMTTDDGATADEQISVGTFHYFVDGTGGNDTNGALDGTGARTVYVGATRAAIRADQVSGAYVSTNGVTITVTYN